MTNTYDTSNEPLGSMAPKVLYNNASNFDEAMNSSSPAFIDRFGLRRETWAGAENQWQQFLQNSGFEPVHLTYVDGTPLIVSRPTQLVDRAGHSYRIKLPATFPFALTGTWATDQSSVVEVVDAGFRAELSNAVSVNQGAAMIGRGFQVAATIAALKTLDKNSPSKAAFVMGYYAQGDGGGGDYYLDQGDTTSADNGGTIIVAADGGRWKLFYLGEINVKQFGAVGDGLTDSTAACQAAIDFANPKGLQVYAPSGLYAVGGSGLVVSNVGSGSTGGTQSIGYRTGIRGDGQGSSIFLWTGGAVGSCLKVITGGDSRVLFENFSLLQSDISKVGVGLLLMQTSHAEFKNITSEGFEYGLRAEDNFSITFNTCRFAKCNVGAYAFFNFVSRPNDFAFNNCNFKDNVIHGGSFKNPTTLLIKGGSFEGNGDNIANYGALKIDGNPIDGIAGLTIEGVYFENNAGSFDIGVLDSASGGIHNVTGCTFNRISSTRFTSGNIVLYKNNLNWRTMIRVHGNGFAGFGTYVASSTRRYIQVVAPVDNFYVMDIGLNIWGNSTEIPDVAGALSTPRNIGVAVRFNGTTGAIDGISTNVQSVTRNGVGDYTVLYAKNLKLAKNVYSVGMAEASMWPELFSESVGSIHFKTKNASGVYADFVSISLMVYGEDGGI
jgi:hypothetical protein